MNDNRAIIDTAQHCAVTTIMTGVLPTVVPYNLIGEKVDIRVTKNVVEVFFHASRVASHRRLQTIC